MRQHVLLASAFLAVMASACSSAEAPRGGTFVYDCGVAWDPACAGTDGAPAVPQKVAVGSSFAVRYAATSGRFAHVRFEPADVITGEPAYLRARRPGTVDIVAVDSYTEEEIDRMTVEVREPRKIELLDARTGKAVDTELRVGEGLAIAPVAAADEVLAGVVEPELTVTPPDALVRDAAKPGWYFRAKKPGTVVLTARHGTATGTLRLDISRRDKH